MSKPHYRTVFISDLHLGAVGAKVEAVHDFLESFTCDHLFLVGDIIDGWVGRKDRKWSPAVTAVIKSVFEHSNCGTKVNYTPGNHDAFMRRIHGVMFGEIEIQHSFRHELLEGRELLVVHGDLFDRTCTKYKPVAFIGAWMYEAVTGLNAKVNENRNEKGRRNIDFASALKRGVKKFVGKATHFEQSVIEFAKENKFDGVVCGHVHRPMIDFQPDGFIYINDGDWVEHCTAVVEHTDGRLELLHYQPQTDRKSSDPKESMKGLVTTATQSDSK